VLLSPALISGPAFVDRVLFICGGWESDKKNKQTKTTTKTKTKTNNNK